MDEAVFEHGPFARLQQAIGLIRPPNQCVRKRALLVVLFAWAPVVFLAIAGGVAIRDLFLFDIGVHAKLLLGAPLLIFAEKIAQPRLADIARCFSNSGIIPDEHRIRFDDAIRSTRWLLDSPAVEIAIVCLAYLIGAAMRSLIPFNEVSWLLPHASQNRNLLLAAWWYRAVSLPLFQILVLIWLWRLFILARFLWLMSKLPLRLVPSHPDLVGGLAFAGTYVPAFSPLAFVLSLAVSGGIANLVWRDGHSLLMFKYVPVLMAVLLVLVVAGPLLVFAPSLRRARFQGILEYGDLAAQLGRRLEDKWFRAKREVDMDALAAPDFSATTDLYQVASKPGEMNSMPIDRKELTAFVIATLIPFVPLVLQAMPLSTLLESIVKLLL